MRKISTTVPLSQRTSRVAEFIDHAIRDRPEKTVGEIADEARLPQRNMLSMIRSGVTKLPFERIRDIAGALGVDPAQLLRLALDEYQPHLRDLLYEVEGQVLTRNEKEVVRQWQLATKGRDPSIEPMASHFVGLVQRLMTLPESQVSSRTPEADRTVGRKTQVAKK